MSLQFAPIPYPKDARRRRARRRDAAAGAETHNVGRPIIAWGGAQRDPMKTEAYKRDAQSAVARRPDDESYCDHTNVGLTFAPPKPILSRLAPRINNEERIRIKMKKYALILIFLLMESILILSCAKIPVVWSVYGGRILSDDDKSSELLYRMAQKTNNRDDDVLNSLALIEVARLSDGALADMMGSVCINDLINKTETIIYIFENFGQDKLEPYFLLISFELTICDEFRSDSKCFNDFVSTLRKRDLDHNELKTLEKIIEAIKMKYDLYKDK